MARPRALRLFFSYEGSEIRLMSAEQVEMPAPPSDPLGSVEGASGFWYELQDTSRRPLYRRMTHSPIRTSAEVLTDDERRPIAREQPSEMRGYFALIAPNLEDAASVVLVGSAPEAEPAVRSAQEIARFDLPVEPRRQRPS